MATSSCWWMARSSPYWELAFFSGPFLPHQPGCTALVQPRSSMVLGSHPSIDSCPLPELEAPTLCSRGGSDEDA